MTLRVEPHGLTHFDDIVFFNRVPDILQVYASGRNATYPGVVADGSRLQFGPLRQRLGWTSYNGKQEIGFWISTNWQRGVLVMSTLLTLREYQLLVEKAPIMIWRSTLTMECDYFNETWLQFTGRSLEQEVGNGWAEGVHAEDVDRCLAIYKSHFSKRLTFEMEYRLRRHDGAYRWIFDRGTPYSDNEGNFLGYIGSCVDVTERVDAQAELARAQEAEVNRLKGLLPICCQCKKIRNDENYWEQIETYISNHSEALFSHGYCPECAEKVKAEVQKHLAEGTKDRNARGALSPDAA